MAKRMGRPSKPPTPGELAPLSVRITATLKERLQAAAEGNGRSISAEVESRLEDSFNKEEALAAIEELRTTRTRLEAGLDEVKAQLAALAAKVRRR
jgi:predicted transcriptional regulator